MSGIWIMSQENVRLAIVNNFVINQRKDKFTIDQYIDDDYLVLGRYNSEERCLEIIDEIKDIIYRGVADCVPYQMPEK